MSNDVRQAKEAFGARLRQIRKEASLTGRILAERTGLHFTKVSRVEHGRQSLTDAQIRAWCAACGAEDQSADLIAMARSIESLYREWRRLARTGMRLMQESSTPRYERTKLLRVYEHTVLPGLFQTAAYSREIMDYWVRFLGVPNDSEAATAARLERQRVLHGGTRRFVFVLAEQVLRTRIGSAATMVEQLDHVLTLMAMPRISVGIIPASAERFTVSQVAFWIWDESTVTIETISAELEITRRDEVDMYTAVFDQLRQSAVYGEQARALIIRFRDEFLQQVATT